MLEVATILTTTRLRCRGEEMETTKKDLLEAAVN